MHMSILSNRLIRPPRTNRKMPQGRHRQLQAPAHRILLRTRVDPASSIEHNRHTSPFRKMAKRLHRRYGLDLQRSNVANHSPPHPKRRRSFSFFTRKACLPALAPIPPTNTTIGTPSPAPPTLTSAQTVLTRYLSELFSGRTFVGRCHAILIRKSGALLGLLGFDWPGCSRSNSNGLTSACSRILLR